MSEAGLIGIRISTAVNAAANEATAYGTRHSPQYLVYCVTYSMAVAALPANDWVSDAVDEEIEEGWQ